MPSVRGARAGVHPAALLIADGLHERPVPRGGSAHRKAMVASNTTGADRPFVGSVLDDAARSHIFNKAFGPWDCENTIQPALKLLKAPCGRSCLMQAHDVVLSGYLVLDRDPVS